MNIHIVSKYAFRIIHAHGTHWKERGLLTSGNKDIKYSLEILALLEAVALPPEVAVMHCPAHQQTHSYEAKENQAADKAARTAAIKT